MADRDPGELHAVAEVDDPTATAKRTAKRKKLFGAFAAGVALIGGGYTAMNTLVWSKHAVTDNAYVGADVAQVTSQLAAPVSAVLVEDTRQVHKGDVLVRLETEIPFDVLSEPGEARQADRAASTLSTSTSVTPRASSTTSR